VLVIYLVFALLHRPSNYIFTSIQEVHSKSEELDRWMSIITYKLCCCVIL